MARGDEEKVQVTSQEGEQYDDATDRWLKRDMPQPNSPLSPVHSDTDLPSLQLYEESLPNGSPAQMSYVLNQRYTSGANLSPRSYDGTEETPLPVLKKSEGTGLQIDAKSVIMNIPGTDEEAHATEINFVATGKLSERRLVKAVIRAVKEAEKLREQEEGNVRPKDYKLPAHLLVCRNDALWARREATMLQPMGDPINEKSNLTTQEDASKNQEEGNKGRSIAAKESHGKTCEKHPTASDGQRKREHKPAQPGTRQKAADRQTRSVNKIADSGITPGDAQEKPGCASKVGNRSISQQTKNGLLQTKTDSHKIKEITSKPNPVSQKKRTVSQPGKHDQQPAKTSPQPRKSTTQTAKTGSRPGKASSQLAKPGVGMGRIGSLPPKTGSHYLRADPQPAAAQCLKKQHEMKSSRNQKKPKKKMEYETSSYETVSTITTSEDDESKEMKSLKYRKHGGHIPYPTVTVATANLHGIGGKSTGRDREKDRNARRPEPPVKSLRMHRMSVETKDKGRDYDSSSSRRKLMVKSKPMKLGRYFQTVTKNAPPRPSFFGLPILGSSPKHGADFAARNITHTNRHSCEPEVVQNVYPNMAPHGRSGSGLRWIAFRSGQDNLQGMENIVHILPKGYQLDESMLSGRHMRPRYLTSFVRKETHETQNTVQASLRDTTERTSRQESDTHGSHGPLRVQTKSEGTRPSAHGKNENVSFNKNSFCQKRLRNSSKTKDCTDSVVEIFPNNAQTNKQSTFDGKTLTEISKKQSKAPSGIASQISHYEELKTTTTVARSDSDIGTKMNKGAASDDGKMAEVSGKRRPAMDGDKNLTSEKIELRSKGGQYFPVLLLIPDTRMRKMTTYGSDHHSKRTSEKPEVEKEKSRPLRSRVRSIDRKSVIPEGKVAQDCAIVKDSSSVREMAKDANTSRKLTCGKVLDVKITKDSSSDSKPAPNVHGSTPKEKLTSDERMTQVQGNIVDRRLVKDTAWKMTPVSETIPIRKLTKESSLERKISHGIVPHGKINTESSCGRALTKDIKKATCDSSAEKSVNHPKRALTAGDAGPPNEPEVNVQAMPETVERRPTTFPPRAMNEFSQPLPRHHHSFQFRYPNFPRPLIYVATTSLRPTWIPQAQPLPLASPKPPELPNSCPCSPFNSSVKKTPVMTVTSIDSPVPVQLRTFLTYETHQKILKSMMRKPLAKEFGTKIPPDAGFQQRVSRNEEPCQTGILKEFNA